MAFTKSADKDEWWGHQWRCTLCGREFMTGSGDEPYQPEACPFCGDEPSQPDEGGE
jgi:rubrerythrin